MVYWSTGRCSIYVAVDRYSIANYNMPQDFFQKNYKMDEG